MSESAFSKLPEGIVEVPSKPYAIKNVKKGLIFGDTHFGFHDKKAIEVTLKYRDDFDFILLNGDILDFYALSFFSKNPSINNIKDEINTAKEFFKALREMYPKVRIIFYEGNHDERLRRYIWDKAPALYGIEEISLKSLTELDKHKIEFIENGGGWKIGSLHGLHGNEAGLKGGINVSRTMLLRTFENCLFNNFHKTSSSPAKTLDGKTLMNWSVGCLCGLKPKYRPINDWNWGFAIVETNEKEFQVENKIILPDYKIV